ncbi:MAG: hypothetical protein ACQEP3_01805 [Patescibacteria group bacterium]
MKKITFAILILTISFGSAPGIAVNSVQISAVEMWLKIEKKES